MDATPGQPLDPRSDLNPAESADPGRWQLGLRVLAMPADTNPYGDIFGGWILSQADLAGATVAVAQARGRVATVAVQDFRFLSPVRVGDLVELFARAVQVGNSSITVEVSAWARREALPENGHQVAEGRLVYVAVDADGRSRSISNISRQQA
ncbi:acyl-CoA thioesterase [Thiohalocapsa marina]|uniref:Acyl-CoA thioesterase n=1 Tax=Thiohalocapsa marina TaxID=424902 RepID=A0A5M8FRQ7_9GAMM|nr:acyl-CoA thioesterase [Thiohalocapsa marina]KAA6186331.1 acyl-CoA thioesterase [Thiohalocapsa marina]